LLIFQIFISGKAKKAFLLPPVPPNIYKALIININFYINIIITVYQPQQA